MIQLVFIIFNPKEIRDIKPKLECYAGILPQIALYSTSQEIGLIHDEK